MLREKLVCAARDYLGVPFAHQGRSRLGVDCLGLLVCVARECGLQQAELDETDYGHYPDEVRLRRGIAQAMELADEMEAGDVLLLRQDGSARHLAIVGDYPQGGFSLIHAYAPARKVIEHRLDAVWRQQIAQVWRLKGEAPL